MATLKELFATNCTPTITVKMLQDLERFTQTYEVRDENPMAFNTAMLAVNKAYFYPKDADAIFAIFNIDKSLFVSDIKQCPAIDSKFNVTSNEFNILVIYLIYLIKKCSLTGTLKYNACLNLLKLLHYKFFTGKVASSFPYAAKEPVMRYTIDNLNAKFDIRNAETDTWKKLIYKHCEATMEPGGIYSQVFATFAPDAAICKAISDIHTRLCRKVVLVAEAYYDNNKHNRSYTTSSMTFEDNETGMQKLGDLKGTLDIAINRICMAVLNTNEFIDEAYANLAARLTSSVRKDNVIEILNLFSGTATQQVKDKETRQIIYDKQKQQLYVGYVTLIEELVQKTYRRAAMSGVDLNSNVAVLNMTKNVYTSSRIIDTDVMTIKNSVDLFMQKTRYTRPGTLISLRLALILYIILLSFKYR